MGYAKSCNDVLAIAQQIVNAHQPKPNGIIVTSSSSLKNSWGARRPLVNSNYLAGSYRYPVNRFPIDSCWPSIFQGHIL